MAGQTSAVRIVLFVTAISVTVWAATYLASASQPVVHVSTCTPVPPNVTFLGPALTIPQVEATSLRKIAGSPTAPQVPFGYTNSEWLRLKDDMRPGDTVHEFKTGISGGHMVLRGKCLVGQITSWIR